MGRLPVSSSGSNEPRRRCWGDSTTVAPRWQCRCHPNVAIPIGQQSPLLPDRFAPPPASVVPAFRGHGAAYRDALPLPLAFFVAFFAVLALRFGDVLTFFFAAGFAFFF